MNVCHRKRSLNCCCDSYGVLWVFFQWQALYFYQQAVSYDDRAVLVTYNHSRATLLTLDVGNVWDYVTALRASFVLFIENLNA